MKSAMTFAEALGEAGFDFVQERRNGDRQYGLRSNPYLAWWVLTHPDGTVELSWEFELGAYLKSKGFHISVQDELSLLLFPRAEIRGPADADWLATQLEQAQQQLASVDLLGAG